MQDHQIPRRRVPLLAGERVGLVIGSPSTPMLSAETGAQTALWLEHATLELQRIQVLSPGECLVAVASDLSYARTNTGKLVAL
ncbi:MAG: hypothetical protein ACLQUY_00455 [Ktedonobacterales bacterium]